MPIFFVLDSTVKVTDRSLELIGTCNEIDGHSHSEPAFVFSELEEMNFPEEITTIGELASKL